MNARDKFSVGDHVLLNDHAHAYRPDRPRFGVVTGYGRSSHLVRVKDDGLTRKGKLKMASTWHMDFWDVIGKAGE